MNEKEKRELQEEADLIFEETDQDWFSFSRKAPTDMLDRLKKDIQALNTNDTEANTSKSEPIQIVLSEEEKELIRLGRIYKKRKKNAKRYWVLIAAAVGLLAFGITSAGEPKKLFEKISFNMGGKEQLNVYSEDGEIVTIEGCKEEEAYQEIENTYGFAPVRMLYLPEGVEFKDFYIGEETQLIYLVYSDEKEFNLSYMIWPSYRTGSLGSSNDDKIVDSHEIEVRGVPVTIKEIFVEENGTSRWNIEFEHKNVHYFVRIHNGNLEEIHKIAKNLFFS